MSGLALDRMQHIADPLADDTVAAVLGSWAEVGIAERLERIRVMNRLIGGWKTNGDLDGWRAVGEGVTPGIAAPLEAYVQAGRQLPPWADADQIARAERLFFDQGPLSCLLLFCRSLPDLLFRKNHPVRCRRSNLAPMRRVSGARYR